MIRIDMEFEIITSQLFNIFSPNIFFFYTLRDVNCSLTKPNCSTNVSFEPKIEPLFINIALILFRKNTAIEPLMYIYMNICFYSKNELKWIGNSNSVFNHCPKWKSCSIKNITLISADTNWDFRIFGKVWKRRMLTWYPYYLTLPLSVLVCPIRMLLFIGT